MENDIAKILISESSCSTSSCDDSNANATSQNINTIPHTKVDGDINIPDLDVNIQGIVELRNCDSTKSISEKYLQFSHRENLESPEKQEEKELNSILQGRIASLHEVIMNLRDELKQELTLWKKEKEEFQFLRERSDIFALEEAAAAARAAAAAYAAESPLSEDLGDILDVTSEHTLRELTILEYEKELAKYQDAYSLAQAEKRYNNRKQMIAKAYKQKLIEVERLCNEELEKIRENANCLQPLKETVSRWLEDKKNCGDSNQDFTSNEALRKDRILNENYSTNNVKKIDVEVNMVPEIFVARFQQED